MKKLAFYLFFTSIVLALQGQQILLVDNTPTAPGGSHVYADLQVAVDDALAGDIIHVKPSNTSYGDIVISNDSISIFGIGFNPDKEILLKSTVNRLDVEASNIRISGLVVATIIDIGNNAANTSVGNIQIENCQVTGTGGIDIGLGNPETTSNVIVRNTISNTMTIGVNANATVVTNSVIYYSTSTSAGALSANNGTLISHCLFYGDGATRNAFSELNNSTISNCIFYGRAPQISSSGGNNTFNNNFSSNTHNDVFPTGGGNSVNGTIPSASGTVFSDTNITALSTLIYNQNWDPALDPSSTELIGTGDDGTDVGLSGGSIPFAKNGTGLPYIKSFIVPSVIKQGDDLDVSINAVGN